MCLPRKQLTLHLSLLRSFCCYGNRCYKHDAPTELAAVEPFFTQSLKPELRTRVALQANVPSFGVPPSGGPGSLAIRAPRPQQLKNRNAKPEFINHQSEIRNPK